MCFNPYLGFGVNLLSCTGFCVVVTHAASWELFGHHHPQFFCGEPFLHLGTVCKFSLLICGSCICFSLYIFGYAASFSHAQAGRLYFFPSVVWVSFPSDFIVQDRLLFSPCCELCLLICFGIVKFPWESFWPR